MPNIARGADDASPDRLCKGDVVVCVPTFRRPDQLARLLRALIAQRGVAPFDIVVGNNEDRDLRSYSQLTAIDLPPLRVLDVATRGVSAVRNAMVADVLKQIAVPRWIACLDDDQEPEPGWLAALLEAGTRHDADLVGGPVTRLAPLDTFWSHGAADTSYLPTASGPTDMLNEAGNLLLSIDFLRRLKRPPFSLDFGKTGGEDYEFFLHARSLGARIVWAPGARVSEPLPPGRLTFRAYVSRFFQIAAYQARAERRYHGVGSVVSRVLREVVKGPVVCMRSLVRDRSPRRAIGIIVQYAAMVAGRVVGLAGARSDRYGGESR